MITIIQGNINATALPLGNGDESEKKLFTFPAPNDLPTYLLKYCTRDLNHTVYIVNFLWECNCAKLQVFSASSIYIYIYYICIYRERETDRQCNSFFLVFDTLCLKVSSYHYMDRLLYIYVRFNIHDVSKLDYTSFYAIIIFTSVFRQTYYSRRFGKWLLMSSRGSVPKFSAAYFENYTTFRELIAFPFSDNCRLMCMCAITYIWYLKDDVSAVGSTRI
jgi:hypothetical protein